MALPLGDHWSITSSRGHWRRQAVLLIQLFGHRPPQSTKTAKTGEKEMIKRFLFESLVWNFSLKFHFLFYFVGSLDTFGFEVFRRHNKKTPFLEVWLRPKLHQLLPGCEKAHVLRFTCRLTPVGCGPERHAVDSKKQRPKLGPWINMKSTVATQESCKNRVKTTNRTVLTCLNS